MNPRKQQELQAYRTWEYRGGILSLIASVCIGFITFGSILSANPSLVWGAFAAIGIQNYRAIAIFLGLAGGITERDVFWEDVRLACKAFFVDGPFVSLKRAIARKMLLETAHKLQKGVDAGQALQPESEYLGLYDQFKTAPHKEQKQELYFELQQLEDQYLGNNGVALQRYEEKKYYLGFGLVLAFASGLVFGFSGANDGVTTLMSLFGVATGTAVPWGILIVAGLIGFFSFVTYMMLMYKFVKDVVENNALAQVIKGFWEPKKDEDFAWTMARRFLGLLAGALSIFVTCMTGGTFLKACTEGLAKLFFHGKMVLPFLARALSFFMVMCHVFINIFFVILHSVNSVVFLIKKAKEFKISARDPHENTWQRYNPFRFLNKCLSVIGKVAFLGVHSFGIGAISGPGGQMAGSPTAAIATGGTSEFLSDFDFVIKYDISQSSHYREYKEWGLLLDFVQPLYMILRFIFYDLPLSIYKRCTEEDVDEVELEITDNRLQENPEGCSHDHSGTVALFFSLLRPVIVILQVFAIGWHWLGTGCSEPLESSIETIMMPNAGDAHGSGYNGHHLGHHTHSAKRPDPAHPTVVLVGESAHSHTLSATVALTGATGVPVSPLPSSVGGAHPTSS